MISFLFLFPLGIEVSMASGITTRRDFYLVTRKRTMMIRFQLVELGLAPGKNKR